MIFDYVIDRHAVYVKNGKFARHSPWTDFAVFTGLETFGVNAVSPTCSQLRDETSGLKSRRTIFCGSPKDLNGFLRTLTFSGRASIIDNVQLHMHMFVKHSRSHHPSVFDDETFNFVWQLLALISLRTINFQYYDLWGRLYPVPLLKLALKSLENDSGDLRARVWNPHDS
jgi:hypothetical protein